MGEGDPPRSDHFGQWRGAFVCGHYAEELRQTRIK